MNDFAPYLQVADKLGVMVLGVVFIVALFRKMVVFGWLYTQAETDLRTCRDELYAKAAKLETEVEALRRERSAGAK
jgi:hypothetical protein